MAIMPCNQLSLSDIFSDCQEIYKSDKPEFLSLLQLNIDLDEIIPDSLTESFLCINRQILSSLLATCFCFNHKNAISSFYNEVRFISAHITRTVIYILNCFGKGRIHLFLIS